MRYASDCCVIISIAAGALPGPLQQIPVRAVYLFAERCYRPARSFEGELSLFRATIGEGDDEPYIERYEDPCLAGAGALREESGFTTSPAGIRACSRSRTFESWRSSCNYPSTTRLLKKPLTRLYPS